METINNYLQENQEYKIYCDMDGVLCNWDKQLEGLGYGNVDQIKSKGGDALLWKLIYKAGLDFWKNMPWTVDGKDLWNYIKGNSPTMLSAPPRSGKEIAIKGKSLWIKRELGSKVPAIFKASNKKYELASPNSILIDDRTSNIEEWSRADGIAILHTSAKETIAKLRKMGL